MIIRIKDFAIRASQIQSLEFRGEKVHVAYAGIRTTVAHSTREDFEAALKQWQNAAAPAEVLAKAKQSRVTKKKTPSVDKPETTE